MVTKQSRRGYTYINKIDSKSQMFTIDKECHILIKGIIQQEYIAIINIYAPNIKAYKYRKPILTDL